MAVDLPDLAPAAARVAAPARRRLRRPSAKILVGLGVLVFFVLMAIIGPMAAPYHPSTIGLDALAPPSAAHLPTRCSGLSISSASAPTATTAVVNFSQSSYTDLYYITGQLIVPESQWSKVGNPATYTDPNPVGTGPYVLSSFSANGLTYTKNPHYWQPGVPKVEMVDFPVYASNTSANLALENGSLGPAGDHHDVHPQPHQVPVQQPRRPRTTSTTATSTTPSPGPARRRPATSSGSTAPRWSRT
jgi:ABC-type transport system substrate-binding protein